MSARKSLKFSERCRKRFLRSYFFWLAVVFEVSLQVTAAPFFYDISCVKMPPGFLEKVDQGLKKIYEQGDQILSCQQLNDFGVDKVYKLTFSNHAPLVVRLNRRIAYATKRTVERHQMAAAVDVAPSLYYLSPHQSVMIMPFVPGTVVSNFSDPETIKLFVQAIKKFHATYAERQSFPEPYTIGTRAYNRLSEIEKQLSVPKETVAVYYDALKKLAAFDAQYDKPQPIHGDLNQGNLLRTDNKIHLIDWGDSVSSDIFDDLGGVAHYFAMTPAEEAALLQQYFGDSPPKNAALRLRVKRLETLLHHAGWAYLQLIKFNAKPEAYPLLVSACQQKEKVTTLTEWMRAHPGESFNVQTPERAQLLATLGLGEFLYYYRTLETLDA